MPDPSSTLSPTARASSEPGGRRRHVVIGTGAIAHAHAEAVRRFPDRAEVVAAVDLDADRAATFAEQFGIPTASSDLAAVLADGADLAHICTPPGSHVPLGAACLEAGVPVLLEKPPALSLAEMDTLIQASERTGVPGAVIFQHRFGAAARRLRSWLATGRLGRPLVAMCNTQWFRAPSYFEVPWRGKWANEGGGPTMGHGIHQVDLMLSLLGPWAEVGGMAARLARDTQTEDVSTALVRFEDGALGTIVNSLLSPREASVIRIDTEHATIELEHLYGYSDQDWRFTPAPGHESLAKEWSAALDTHSQPTSHTEQMGAILDALDAGQAPPVSLADARSTLELVAGTYASAFTGARVARGEIGPGHPFYARMDGTGAPWAQEPTR